MANKLLKTELGILHADVLSLPYNGLLPEDKVGLLKWRINVRQRCLHDMEFRAGILQACAEDVVFFAQTFIFLHETRPLPGQALGKFPFFPDPDQQCLLSWFAKYMGRSDMTVSKTRGIGVSYLACIVVLWLWLFHGEQLEFALVSIDDDALDKKGRPSSLMGKLDLMFANLPAWMRLDPEGKTILRRTQDKHQFINLLNGNAVLGFVPSDNKLRSGRYFTVVLDEAAFFPADIQRWMASAHGTSNSIIWVSTFNGTANMFFHISQDDNPIVDVVRAETWWQENPRWYAGAYKSVAGRIVVEDKTYSFPDGYSFSHELPGLLRSPKVDAAFNRPGADKQTVQEEIYGIAVQDSRKLFSKRVIRQADSTCQPAVWQGNLNIETGEWEEDMEGSIKLWEHPRSLTGDYMVSADPALGVSLLGAFAGLNAWDIKTGQQILTAQIRMMEPVDFARLTVAVCKALAGPRPAGYARLAYESTGINQAFANEIKRLRWPAVWTDDGKDTPGLHNRDKGEVWFIELGRAIQDREIVVRDEVMVAEAKLMEYDKKRDLVFAGKVGHADLLMAAAIGWWAARARRRAIVDAQKPKDGGSLIESEPVMQAKKRRGGVWSEKFSYN